MYHHFLSSQWLQHCHANMAPTPVASFGAEAIADEDDEAVQHQGMGYYSGSNQDDLKLKERITENLDGL